MKRFFTLLAAMITFMGITATAQQLVPNAKKIQPDKKFERTINSHTGMKPVVSRKSSDKTTTPISRVQKAAAETIECPYDEWAIQDYGSDLWFNAIDLQKEHWFYFDPLVSLYSIQMGKEYTLNDMQAEYTYVQDIETFEKDFVTEVTFIPGEYGKPIPGFEAWCTTESGASYHVFYQAPEVPTEFTEVEVGPLTYVSFKNFTATQGVFQFVGENDSYSFGICISSEGTIVGSYTVDDVFGLDNYTYFNDGIEEVKLCNVELTVTRLEKDNDYHFDAKLYGYNGKVYHVSGDYIEPVVEKTIDITATNLEIDNSMFDITKMYYGYGVATLTASNSEYAINGYLYSYGDLLGHYRDDDRSAQYWIITCPDGEKAEIFSANFDLDKVDGIWSIKGSILCWNNVQYNINLTGEAGDDLDPYDAREYNINVTYDLEDIDEFEVNPSEKYAYIRATSQERADTWFSLIYIDGDELQPGTYPITDTYEAGTVQAGVCQGTSVYPTMYAYVDEEGYIGDMWYCSTGTVDVSYDADGNVSMECNAQNTNGLTVHVVVNPIANGIKTIDTSASEDVYSLSGVRMNSASDLNPGVYVINGRKVVVK